MKRYLLLTLCLISIGLLMSGCKDDTTQSDTSGGKSAEDYTIIVGENASQDERLSAEQLRDAIADKTGTGLVIDTDNNVHDHEILVGLTNREESISAFKELTLYDYSISFPSTRIVIIGGSSGSTAEAINYFINNIENYVNTEGESMKIQKGYSFKNEFDYSQCEKIALQNTYYKLMSDKKLNIAYFGGSVTFGTGATNPETKSWRAITTSWFKSNFPDTKISENKAAIGGTGTIFGAYRAINDLKLLSDTDKPDLVFMEFAINDMLDGTPSADVRVYTETIVRTIWDYAPSCDIVFVFTTNFNHGKTEYSAITAQKEIAKAYNIPCIYIGKGLYEFIVSGNNNVPPSSSTEKPWTTYFTDTVHPTDAGYAKYAEYVANYLKSELIDKKANPTLSEDKIPPSSTVTSVLKHPMISNFKGQDSSKLNGWALNANGYITSATEGASFTFTFTGTKISVWAWAYSDSGAIEYSVDGGAPQTIALYRSYTNHKVFLLAGGLDDREHEITIKVAKNDGNTKCDIRYFMTEGISQYCEVKLK